MVFKCQLTLGQSGGARPEQVDHVQMFANMLHDLQLRHQGHQLGLVDGRLDHLDGHRGGALAPNNAKGLGSNLESFNLGKYDGGVAWVRLCWHPRHNSPRGRKHLILFGCRIAGGPWGTRCSYRMAEGRLAPQWAGSRCMQPDLPSRSFRSLAHLSPPWPTVSNDDRGSIKNRVSSRKCTYIRGSIWNAIGFYLIQLRVTGETLTKRF